MAMDIRSSNGGLQIHHNVEVHDGEDTSVATQPSVGQGNQTTESKDAKIVADISGGKEKTVGDKKAAGIPTGDEIVIGQSVPNQPAGIRPGDGQQPLPNDVAGVQATSKSNPALAALRLIEETADIEYLMVMNKGDRNADKLQEMERLAKQIKEQIDRLEKFNEKFEAVLQEIIGAIGSDQGEHFCKDQMNDQEKKIATMLQEKMGLSAEEAADIANAIGKGGAVGMSLALTVAGAIANGQMEGNGLGKDDKGIGKALSGKTPEEAAAITAEKDKDNAPVGEDTRSAAEQTHALEQKNGMHDLAALAHEYLNSRELFFNPFMPLFPFGFGKHADENSPAAKKILAQVAGADALSQEQSGKVSSREMELFGEAANRGMGKEVGSIIHAKNKEEIEKLRQMLTKLYASMMVTVMIENIAKNTKKNIEKTNKNIPTAQPPARIAA